MLKTFIKNSDWLGRLYYLVAKCGYWLLDVIIPVDRHLILFCSFSGRQVSDSPKAVYDELLQDQQFSHYRKVWVVTNLELAKTGEAVKMGSLKYYWLLFRARYWVANTSIERLVALNRQKHVYINTWHGIPLKKLALDEPHLTYLVKKWYQTVQFDLLTCCSAYDQAIFKRIFPSTKNIEAINLPRNYPLVQKANEQEAILSKLQLKHDRKVILYAPTFRDYAMDTVSDQVIKTLDTLAHKYTVLVREHYFSNVDFPDTVVDVSNYPDVNELMIASDLLITDYSSILFDYALLHKPIFLYLYDWEQYAQYRGFYTSPIALKLPYAYDGKTLVDAIANMKAYDYDALTQLVIKYQADNQSIVAIKQQILNS